MENCIVAHNFPIITADLFLATKGLSFEDLESSLAALLLSHQNSGSSFLGFGQLPQGVQCANNILACASNGRSALIDLL